MVYNEGKKPMIIFGMNIDKFPEDIKLFGKLPEFCDNLFIGHEKKKNKNFIEQYDKIIEDINNNSNNRLKRNYKKMEINKIVERLSKNQPRKYKNKSKKEYFIKSNNINLSRILSSSFSFSTKSSNNNTNIINYRSRRKRKFNDSLNLSIQEKKSLNESYINNLSTSKNNQEKKPTRKQNNFEYIKKWDLPKILKFDKIVGRQKEKPKNPNKFKYMEVVRRSYSPNYDYIYSYNSFSYVNYCPDIKNDFNKVKINLTRKAICSFERMRNSSSKGLYLIDFINNEKKKKKELKLKKIKEKYGKLLDFLNYDKIRDKLKLSLLNINNK